MSIIVPSSSNLQVFIMSLTDKSPDIWNAPDQLKVQSKRRGPLLDSYVWNLHSLGDKFGNFPLYPNSNSKRMSVNDPYWKLIFCDSYRDDQGSSFIVGTDSFNNLSSFSRPVGANLTTKPTISFSPLVHQDYTRSDVSEAHDIIYKCFLFPSYPVLISTTIKENEHYGPVFATNLNISVDDRGKTVNVTSNFLGGRSLFLPPMKLKNLQSTTINNVSNNIPSAVPYRTANIFDCAVEFDLFESIADFLSYTTRKKAFNNRNDFERIVSMNLTVTQNYKTIVTSNSDQRKIQQGPRFWNLTDRKVTGSITWLSNQYNFYIPTSSSLTLYFGSGFYFPMQNVDWQKPIITAAAGQGYLHQFNFIARAVDGAVANGFKSNALGSYVSEFKIPTYLY